MLSRLAYKPKNFLKTESMNDPYKIETKNRNTDGIYFKYLNR